MVKAETYFICQSCGQDFPRWSGQCQACGEWNSLTEEVQNPHPLTQNLPPSPILLRPSDFGGQGGRGVRGERLKFKTEKPISIVDVSYNDETRAQTGIDEIDRVLGGGVVAGSVVLVSGEPGIGKSTLLLQVAEALSQSVTVLYVSGEESARQIRLRAERLGTLSKNLLLFPETNLFAIEKAVGETKPNYLIIDSIQTLFREDVASAPGSVSQVRECANYLVGIAKSLGIPIFIVGHVTKEGNIAGPRLLEHVVDVVLYFEGERHKQFRILRAEKNRFGSTNEVGIFEMKDKGLVEVTNPSQVFLSERPEQAPGSVVTAAIEGTRPLLVEIQALVSPTKMVYPTRKASGVDFNRLAIVIAVLERQMGLKLAAADIFVNAAGGIRVIEPAIDLPIALAIISCYKNKPIDPACLIIGEVGLTGEVRSVTQIEQRIREAEKLGFKKAIIPKANLKTLSKSNINLVAVSSIKEAQEVGFCA
ncbi:MAG: DNA repair protein RadA [Candidatus Margulisbacteria bacterium]|nr:DNA repair protein RadA [Candidatus Margulisiibacteriota bacterium]